MRVLSWLLVGLGVLASLSSVLLAVPLICLAFGGVLYVRLAK